MGLLANLGEKATNIVTSIVTGITGASLGGMVTLLNNWWKGTVGEEAGLITDAAADTAKKGIDVAANAVQGGADLVSHAVFQGLASPTFPKTPGGGPDGPIV